MVFGSASHFLGNLSLWNEQWSNRDFLPANIRSYWAFRSHISDAWSMKVARVMSRWDNPPQSCVLSVIWTCNGAERKGVSITSFFCLSLCCNNLQLLVHCFLDYGGNVSSACCWLSCEQPQFTICQPEWKSPSSKRPVLREKTNNQKKNIYIESVVL